MLNTTKAIFKTSTSLTGNVKLVVSNHNTAFFESFNDSSRQLKYNDTLTYASNVSMFLSKYVHNKFDVQNYDLSKNNLNSLKHAYTEQIDFTYQYGAKYSNKFNKHRFFAPIWINSKYRPKYFVIFAEKKSKKPITVKDTQHFTIIKTFDLENGVFSKIYDSIVNQSVYSDEPMIFGDNNITCYGININTGLSTSVKNSAHILQQNQYSVLEFDAYISALFSKNNLILNNLLNLEFEFELDDYDAYHITGFYCDDAAIADVSKSEHIATQQYFANCSTFLSRKNDDGFNELTKCKLLPSDIRTYDIKLLSLSSDSSTVLNHKQKSFAQLDVRKSIAVGDYIEIIENGKSFKIYCDLNRNYGQFFEYSTNIKTQIANIEDAINRLNTKYKYTIEFGQSNKLVIYSTGENVIIDSPDAWYPLSYNEVITSTQKSRYSYSLNTSIDANKAIKINKNYIKHIKLSDINIVKINDAEFDIVNTIEFDDFYIFELNGYIISDTDFIIRLISRKEYQFGFLSFIDIDNFDISTVNSAIENKHKTHKHITKLKESDLFDKAAFDEILQSIKNENAYIKNISSLYVDYDKNVYSMLNEYDVKQYATLNKINQSFVKWSSAFGYNAYNTHLSANYLIQFNHANLSPIFDIEPNYDVHTLQYDYFIIGLVDEDDEHVSSELGDDLSLDGTIYKFVHTRNIPINGGSYNAYTEKHLYSIIQKRNNKAYATFRGVEYEFSSIYDGYKFAIVHTNKNEFQILEHVNINDKSIIVEIQHPINVYTLNSYTDESEITSMKRFAYYSNFVDLVTQKVPNFSLMSFNNFYKVLNNSDKIETFVSKPNNIVITEYLQSAQNDISHEIIVKDEITKYMIQRYTMHCVPTTLNIMHCYSFEKYKNCILPFETNSIIDYGIFKVGDADTLSTDKLNDVQPIHYLHGEVVYDLIEFNTNISEFKPRFYYHKQQFNEIDNILINHSSLVSTLYNIDFNRISHNAFNADKVYVDIKQMLFKAISQHYKAFTEQSILDFCDSLIRKYNITYTIVDSNDKVIDKSLNILTDNDRTIINFNDKMDSISVKLINNI